MLNFLDILFVEIPTNLTAWSEALLMFLGDMDHTLQTRVRISEGNSVIFQNVKLTFVNRIPFDDGCQTPLPGFAC